MFKNDPCTNFFNTVLNSDPNQLAECNEIGVGTLQHGIMAFNNYFNDLIWGTLSGSNMGQLGEITNANVYDFDRGVEYVNNFQMYLMQRWNNDMQNILSGQM